MSNSWKIEKNGDVYNVQVYDLDGTPFIDRQVESFLEACLLVDEVHEKVLACIEPMPDTERVQ